MPPPISTLDVFTSQRFAGNPLAVVLDADGLETAAMQTIAREFNLPETVFVFPPDDPKQRARVRIFTPARGTAVRRPSHGRHGGAAGASRWRRERPRHCDRGGGRAGRLLGAAGRRGRPCDSFDIPKMPQRLGPVRDVAKLAAALCLEVGDSAGKGSLPENWTAGIAFTFVPVRGLEVIGRARPDMGRWSEVSGPNDPPGAFLFCGEVDRSGPRYHARMFAPAMGIVEDPATGSAVAAFAGVIAADRGDGRHDVAIEQGTKWAGRA